MLIVNCILSVHNFFVLNILNNEHCTMQTPQNSREKNIYNLNFKRLSFRCILLMKKQNKTNTFICIYSNKMVLIEFPSNWISDCTYSDKNGKHHGHTHSHSANKNISSNNNTTNLNNNNTNTNNNNHQKVKHQFSISEDGPTITEDDLDNLINQSINEWQQRQKSNSDLDKSTIDVDATPTTTHIIS